MGGERERRKVREGGRGGDKGQIRGRRRKEEREGRRGIARDRTQRDRHT